MAQKAPQAPMNRRTTYQAAGTRATGKGSVVTTHGGGSTATINPGSSRGARTSTPARRPAPASSGSGGTSSGGKGGRSGSGGQQRRQRKIPGLPGGGRGSSPEYHNYQAIILAEFVAAELLVAATPIATRKNQPGLSPYVPKDLVKLMALGLVYFILELTATGGRSTGRIGAWFGGLVLIVVGLNEATSLAKVFQVLSGGSGKEPKDSIQTVAAQPSAFQQALGSAPGVGSAATTSSSAGGGSGPHSGSAFLAEAAKFIGDPYVFGAAGPNTFDCSGLVQYSLEKIGISAPRTSEEQWGWVDRISRDQLAPGDLIFEQWPGEASPGHVAIYAGGGQIIQAPAPGQDVEKVGWSPSIVHGQGGQIVGYGRVPGLSYGASGPPAQVM